MSNGLSARSGRAPWRRVQSTSSVGVSTYVRPRNGSASASGHALASRPDTRIQAPDGVEDAHDGLGKIDPRRRFLERQRLVDHAQPERLVDSWLRGDTGDPSARLRRSVATVPASGRFGACRVPRLAKLVSAVPGWSLAAAHRRWDVGDSLEVN